MMSTKDEINWEEEEEDENELEFSINSQNGVEIGKEKYFVYSFKLNGKYYNFAIFTKSEERHGFIKFYLSSFIEVNKNEKLMPIDILIANIPVEGFCYVKNFEQAECNLFEQAYSAITDGKTIFSVEKSYNREQLFSPENLRIPKGSTINEFITENNMEGFINKISIEYENENANISKILERAYGKASKLYNKVIKLSKKKSESGQSSLIF